MIRKHLWATPLSLLAVLSLSSPVAYAKGPEIPESKVISTYAPPQIKSTGQTTSVGSGPGTPNDPNDLRRYQTTSRTYAGTIRMLETILQEIRRASPDQSVNPKVGVYNQQMVEAKALGDNLIVVSTGLLRALTTTELPADIKEKDAKKLTISDEDKLNSLAFILAHEYAHLLYKHPQTYPQEHENTKGFTKLIGAGINLMHRTQVLNAQFGGGMSKEFNEANKVLYGAAMASPWIEAEMYRFSYAPYVKDAEQLADYMAADLLTNTAFGKPKYDVEKGIQPLRAFYDTYDDSTKAKLKRLGKEAANTAKDASLQMAATAPDMMLSGGDVGGMMEDTIKLAAITFGVKQLIGRLDRKKVHLYYSTDKRVDAVEDYFQTFYETSSEEANPATLAFFSNFSQTFTKENSAAAAAEQAMAFLARGDIEGAVKALQSVTAGNKLSNTQFLVASGKVAFAQGNFGRAINFYDQAKRKGDVTVQVFRDLSKSHMMQSNYPMAIRALDDGMKRFGDETFIVEKISLQVTLDKQEDVRETWAECQKLSDEDVVKDCEKAAKPVLEPKGEKKGFLKGIGDTVKDTTGL